MADRTTPQDWLAALGARLAAHRLTVDLTERGLKVTNPRVPGCCAEVAHAGDLITCRHREGALWYRTSWGEWIAPAGQIDDAVAAVKGYLSPSKAGAVS